MGRYQTLTQALCSLKDSQNGIGFVRENGGEDLLTYPGLFEAATACLAYLQDRGVCHGDELVIAAHSLRNTVIAYWAALLGGIVPVPLTAPKNKEELRKLANIWDALRCPWLLLDDSLILERLRSEGHSKVTDDAGRLLIAEDVTDWRGVGTAELAEIKPDDIAFVQFSSGSTGQPKGVTLTHRNLLSNAYDIINASSITPDDIFLTWKPISHDFGMIAFHITPLVMGCSQHRMTTKHFIWNATDWLIIASRLRATVLGTPNFGVQHCLSRFDAMHARSEQLDLSSVRIIWNAAEMINASLCADFVQMLVPFGLRHDVFRPGYGLAENTLVVSVVPADGRLESVTVDRHHLEVGQPVRLLDPDVHKDDGMELVLCGPLCAHSRVRIVDDQRVELPDGQLGHVHVQGGCVTVGYYRNDEATHEILLADSWLDTQDLGFIYQGQVVIVGRQKDIIIVGGVNYHLSDIENVILQGVGQSKLNQYVACAIPDPILMVDQLVVFVRHRGKAEQFSAIEREVRRLVMSGMGLTVAQVLPVRSVPKTTSGKVQRYRLVQEYLAAQLPVTEEIMSTQMAYSAFVRTDARSSVHDVPADLVDQVVAVVADFIDVPERYYDRSFFDLGCTSLQLVSMQDALQAGLGVSLDSTFVLDHPSIRELTAELSRRIVGQRNTDSTPRESDCSTARENSVAIIGMGIRLPGGINDESSLWSALENGVDCAGAVPAGRWRYSTVDESKLATTEGGYLPSVDQFDPLFFGISPAEAQSIDPQQRLLLELTWESLENAGIDPQHVGACGSVGVFVGISSHDYLQVARDLGHEPDAYTYTGGLSNAAAGRISYTFGLRGPSMSIDTACSSSLYAVHHAVGELRQGTCDVALAAGVNLILTPDGHLSFTKLGALAPSGRCRSYDDAADGYVRSEGAAVLVLKRIADAENDGDQILAVIRGTAINHNGRSGGFTVPSGEAQSELIRAALNDASLLPDDITYLEGHGSGTPIGDPQEINALARVFAGRENKLVVGSVKSNFGHLEAAAGMAALCKVIVSLRKGCIPGTVHLRTPNRLVDWPLVPLEVRSELSTWPPAVGGLRHAGISSFGISGSNAHIIVEEYQDALRAATSAGHGPRLLRISAGSAAALDATLADIAAWSQNGVTLSDLATSLDHRPALSHRAVMVSKAIEDVPEQMRAPAPWALCNEDSAAGLAFVFPGQGSHYPGMASLLYRSTPRFRAVMDQIDGVLSQCVGFSVVEKMMADAKGALESPCVTQPLIFGVELGLARYWESLGVQATSVLGHSIGEYAAACFAGALCLEQASRMVSERGQIMAAAEENGYMATLLCDLPTAEALVADIDGVYISAVNAAENITVSGLTAAMDSLRRVARARRVFVEKLPVSHPFHSPLLREHSKRFASALSDVTVSQTRYMWVSAQTGRRVVAPDQAGIDYWAEHLVCPVQFASAVETVRASGVRTFLEVGAAATLGGLIVQDHPDDTVALPSLRKGRDDCLQLLETAGELWKLGHTVDACALPGGDSGHRRRDLPHTHFDRQRVWYTDYAQREDQTVSLTSLAQPNTSTTVTRHSGVKEFLQQSVMQITGVTADKLTGSVELLSLGMDSLMLVQLGRRLEREFGVEIPIKHFFESLHTLDQVAAHVAATMLIPEPNPPHKTQVVDAAEIRTDEQLLAMTTASAVSAVPEVTSIIESQLQLMQQQLALLNAQRASAHCSEAAETDDATSTARRSEGTMTGKSVSTPAIPEKTGRQERYSHDIALSDDELTPQQSAFVRSFVADFAGRTARSKEHTVRHRTVLADWIASLNFNPSIKSIVYPLVSDHSEGVHFWDLDGNRYLDTALGYGVHFYGHRPDFIVSALRDQLESGYELGPQNRDAGAVAEIITQLTGVERVAFCNTGSEAVMVALRLARTVTGRDKIVKFVTSFHGSFDGVLAEVEGDRTVPMTVGTPQSMVDDTIVLTYGSDDALTYVREHGEDLAAVLVEPVQSRNPSLQPREFLRELRRLCTERGVALIFDEMITGFRINVGGAQAHFGVQADMVLYGKLIGGGLPIGLVAGRARFLDAVDGGAFDDDDESMPSAETTFFAGTFCKHPLTMAACRAVMLRIQERGVEDIRFATGLTEDFVRRVNGFFDTEEVPFRAVSFGSMYRFEPLAATEMATFTLASNLLFKLIAARGVYVWERRTAFFSVAHTAEDVQTILDAVRDSVRALRDGGFSFRRSEPSLAPLHNIEEGAITANLSSQEQRVYVLSRMRGGNEAYQILGGMLFDGCLDEDVLTAAFDAVAARHEKLRASYALEGAEVVCTVGESVRVERLRFDRRTDPDLTEETIVAQLNAPFDLAKAPLWRYATVTEPDGCQRLLVSFHHLIADGRSVELIFADLARVLNGESLGSVGSMPYSEFVSLQASLAGQAAIGPQRDWWHAQFSTLPEPLMLPLSAPRPEVKDFAGGFQSLRIDDDLRKAVIRLTQEMRTTPFNFYMTAWALLLGVLSGSRDLCIGIPFDQRSLGDFDETVGMFAQSLPLCVVLDPDSTVGDVINQIRDLTLAAVENSAYTYDSVLRDLNVQRNFGRNALFDVMFTYSNAASRAANFGGVTGRSTNVAAPYAMFDLSLEVTDCNGELAADLSHSALFSADWVRNLLVRFANVIAQMVTNPGCRVGDVTVLTTDERGKLLALGTGPVADVPSLAELFTTAMGICIDRVAVEGPDHSLTVGQLNDLVGRCATLLRELGTVPGDLIGIVLPRGAELLVWMLAVRKVGAAWFLMDAQNPASRLSDMIETASPAWVVCSAGMAQALGLGELALVPGAHALRANDGMPWYQGKPEDLAYVCFTSGSTGRPKGIQITCGALANFMVGMPDALRWESGKKVASLTTPGFDIYLLETLLTLVRGGTVVIGDEEAGLVPTAIASLATEHQVDYLQLTPTRLRLLLSDPVAAKQVFSAVDKLFIGGESFPADLLPILQQYSGLEIFNVYGPTETCIWSSVKDLTTASHVSIGEPITNTTLAVLDSELRLVPEGTVGQLWIGGAGVTPGYLNRSDLNEGMFAIVPELGGRIYRTGDEARWVAGELECLGRVDSQVKVRGYRVELEEIEVVLAQHSAVAAAAAVAVTVASGNTVLAGYVQPYPDVAVDEHELREWLAERLNAYMLPTTLTIVDSIPMMVSGKVDRQALRSMAAPVAVREMQEDSSLEAVVERAWRAVLGEVHIGHEDSFFDVGGNSFSIVLLLAELNREFGDRLDVSDLFAHPTIVRQAQILESMLAAGEYVSPLVSAVAPQSWFVETSGAPGRVETDLEDICSRELRDLDIAGEACWLVRSVFALSLCQAFGADDVTFGIVHDRDTVQPVCFDFGNKADLQDAIVDACTQSIERRSSFPLDHMPRRRYDDRVAIAVADGALERDLLLQHFDIVFDMTRRPEVLTISIDYGHRVAGDLMASQLGRFVKLLEIVIAQYLAPTASPTYKKES